MGELDGRDDEIDALRDIPGVSPEKIAKQISGSGKPDGKETPPPPPGKDGKEQGDGKEGKEGKEPKENVPDEATIRAGILSEMFGDQFKTVDEVKKANIPGLFQELDSLRRTKQDLETQLQKKPKHSFASDDFAKFNEFANETGIKDWSVFNKINATDIANMDHMDALVLQYMIENPTIAAKGEPRVRKYIEMTYNVDPKKVESGDLTQDELDNNLLRLEIESGKAKTKLAELKGKIKMPEFKEETPAGPKKWTPEIEKTQKEHWSKVGKAISEGLSKVAIPMRDAKDPNKKVSNIVDFVLPEETLKAIEKAAVDIAVNNQMGIDENDVKGNTAKIQNVALNIRDRIIVDHLDLIAHAIFERARSMTQEEFLKIYANPSKIEKEIPPADDKKKTAAEKQEAAFQAELDRL